MDIFFFDEKIIFFNERIVKYFFMIPIIIYTALQQNLLKSSGSRIGPFSHRYFELNPFSPNTEFESISYSTSFLREEKMLLFCSPRPDVNGAQGNH